MKRKIFDNLSGSKVVAGVLFASALSVVPAHGTAQTADSGNADASDAESSNELRQNKIIVTSQKREQSLIEVPIAVQAFAGEELEWRQLGDLTRFINEIPGASTNISWSPSITQVQLRGSGITGQQGSAVVGFYVDDVPFIIPNAQLAPISSMYDLERVEVLRGPQGTLWGLGSMGGTIRYITPDPILDEITGRAQVSISDMEDGGTGYQVNGMLNLPVVEDKFGIRVSGGYDEFSGFSESPDFPNEEDLNGGDTWHVRVKGLLNVNENVDITASYMHIETQQGFNNVVTVLEPPTIATGAGFRGFTSAETDQFNVTLDWNLGFADLVSTTTYLDHFGPFGLGFGVVPTNGSVVSTTDAQSIAQEVRLVSNSDGPFNWIGGVFYNDAEASFDTALTFDLPFLQGLAGSDTVLTINTESIALFGEVSYELFDGKLVPLIGARYFEDDRSFMEAGTLATGTPSEALLPGDSASGKFDSWNPRFNLSYYPNENTTLYLNAAKGFRSGSQITSVAVTAASLDGINATQSIAPDSVWSYEAGGKFALFDQSLLLELAAYKSEYEDVQAQYTTGIGVVATITGGDSEVSGIEAGFNWNTGIEGLVISGNGSLLDTEWTDVAPSVEANVPGISEGADVPWTPEWSYMLAADYSRPIGDFTGRFNASYTRRGSQFSFTNERSAVISDVSVRVGLEKDGWGLSAFVDNLTDERGPALVAAGSLYTYTPRRMGLTLRSSF